MRVGLWLASAGMVLLASAPAAAQTGERLSADQAAAAFGAREHIIDASLSPDGTKVAVVSPGPKQSTVVQVVDLKANTSKAVNYANGDPLTLRSCGWASDARLVCSLYGISNIDGGWESYSRLIAMDADGGNPVPLGIMQTVQDYVSTSDGYVLDWRDGKTPNVLVAREYVPMKTNNITVGSKAQGLAVDLVDTTTGKGQHIESPDPLVGRYIADGNGNVRIKQQYDTYRFSFQGSGKVNFYYRKSGSRDWLPFSTYDQMSRNGMFPIAVDGSTNVAYVLDKTDGRDALYRVSLDGSMKKELAFADTEVDVSGVETAGRRGRVVGANYTTDAGQVQYFDPEYETLHTKLAKALGSLPLLNILDSSADEKKHLIFASSDTNPGQYYFYDSVAKTLSPLGQERPQLAGHPLGAVKYIHYPAADGTSIPAYLTLPPGSDGKNLPAIVMPHGGPGSRDVWGFDWLAQFFVNRGYAVIQPEFRGSTGFGDAWFQQNGFHSWKTAIGDVNDAGHWLVKQGIANASKLAIFGWSYGGYAALQSNVLDPDLFKAVVAVAPVTDIAMLRSQTSQNVEKEDIGQGSQIMEGSPDRHADAFKAPVLMFHGTKDVNVNVNESRAMDRALKKAGKKSDLVIYPDIDHQLPDSAVRADMLGKTDAFLAKTLDVDP